MRVDSLQALDYWTNVSLENYWKEKVKECKEADNTGRTIKEPDTQGTQ